MGKVHEVIPPRGNIFYADIPVEHRKIKAGDSERNLRIYERMEREGEPFDSRALYYYGRELYFHENYQKGRRVLEAFLERPDGWVENRIDATRQLAGCLYRLGEEEEALRVDLMYFDSAPFFIECMMFGLFIPSSSSVLAFSNPMAPQSIILRTASPSILFI